MFSDVLCPHLVRSAFGLSMLPAGAFRAHMFAFNIFELVRADLLRLDYISCALTILSTILVGKRLWYGWVVAAVNSIIICFIGIHTGQTGFVPANIFCLALYAWNLRSWTRA